MPTGYTVVLRIIVRVMKRGCCYCHLISSGTIKHYPVKAKSGVLTLAGMKAGKQKKPRRGSVVK